MTATTALDLLIDAGLDFEPRCESRTHESGHGHGGPAAYFQTGTCEHTTGLRCAPFVSVLLAGLTLGCSICGGKALSVIPLPGVTK